MSVFYNRFDALRKESGKTLQQVSDDTGIPTSTMAEWKKDSDTRKRLELIASYFDVSVDYLLGRTNDRYSHKTELLTPPILGIVQTAKKINISEELANAIVQLMEASTHHSDLSD